MTKVLTILVLSLFSACSPSLGAPIASSSADVVTPIVLHGRQQQNSMNIGEYRTTQSIVLSCLATVFACTWVAIHPNLPGPWDSEWIKLKRKVVTMIYAIVAPESVAFWALRQRLAAGRIAKEFNQKHGKDDNAPGNFLKAYRSAVNEWWQGPDKNAPNVWTLAHGFFIQMGGFLLYDGKTPKCVLTFEDLQKMVENGEVEKPDITERDINDKSKGDFLTKLIVVLQTTWFVFQCIVRWARNLPVTELEVVTLAFAALNVITYALWWKKPQNVEVAACVQLKSEADRDSHGVEEAGRKDGREAEGVDKDGHEAEGRTEELLIGEGKGSWIVPELRAATGEGLLGWLIGVPKVLILALCRPFSKMPSDDDKAVVRGSLRMPMFYADRYTSGDYLPITAITILFGAFHLIPWSSPFPSTTQLWLWRSSALFITTHPILLVVAILALRLEYHFVYDVLWYTYGWTLPLYIVARLVLLVLAFATLRHLPSGAYTDIEWTSFVPHF